MTGTWRLFGADSSAYSTKLRSYLRYKGFEHEWKTRNQETEAELKSLSRFPTLPVLVSPAGVAVHDTTPLIEALEADRPEPAATPADPALAFLAGVLEEYADSWLSKAVYQYRWTRKRDQRQAAQRAITEYYTVEAPSDRKSIEDASIVRMLSSLRLVGLEGETGAVVEKSFKRFLKLLDDHLRHHLYLFGGRPSIADFAIAGQLIQMLKDPTPSKMIEKDAEFVLKWCEFLEDPKAGGPFESLADLSPTLLPLFRDELAACFLPWAAENLEASLARLDQFEVKLGRDTVSGTPLRSSARSFRELRRRFVTAQEIADLKAFTDAAGATSFLLRPAMPGRTDEDASVADGAPVDAPAEEAAAPAEAPARTRKPRRRRPRSGDAAMETAVDDGAETDAAVASPADDDAAGADEAASPDEAD